MEVSEPDKKLLNRKRQKNLLIFVGILIPALINLIFIIQFNVNTIFWDAWNVMFPLVERIYEGQSIQIENLFSQANESRIFFPKLLLLTVALATKYNTLYDSIIAWSLIAVSLFIIWKLLIYSKLPQWLVIPSSWLLFSLSSYHSLIFGFSGVHWFLSIVSFLGSIYYINRVENSKIFIIPALGLATVSTFSYITGLLVWPICLLSFLKIKENRWKLFSIFSLGAIINYALFFYNWIRPGHHPDPISTTVNTPIEFLFYVPTYLGNGLGFLGNEFLGRVISSTITGFVILALFLIMIIISIKFKIHLRILPWIQIGLFSIFVALITSAGRHDFGVGQALSSRYVIFSNLFIVSVAIISFVVISYIVSKRTPNTFNRWKLSGLILIVLLGIYVSSSYITGLNDGITFHNRLYEGTFCLVNFEFASDECINKIHMDPQRAKGEAKVLEKYNLGPFNSDFLKLENEAIFELIYFYNSKQELQDSFPEVKTKSDYSRLICWAKNAGIKENNNLEKFASYYDEHCK